MGEVLKIVTLAREAPRAGWLHGSFPFVPVRSRSFPFTGGKPGDSTENLKIRRKTRGGDIPHDDAEQNPGPKIRKLEN